MAPHSSTLAWKIPWTEEPGRVQSMGSLRVRHSWATSLSPVTFMHWKRKWQPTSVFLPGESQGRGAWWAAIYGAAQRQTWLKRMKWLSSSSSSSPVCNQGCGLCRETSISWELNGQASSCSLTFTKIGSVWRGFLNALGCFLGCPFPFYFARNCFIERV